MRSISNRVQNILELIPDQPQFLPSWEEVRRVLWLPTTLAIIAYSLASLLLVISFFRVLLGISSGNTGDEVRNIGLVLGAVLGAPFVVVWQSKIAADRAKTAAQEMDINRHDMITNRIAKAVDQLGAVRRIPRRKAASETDKKEAWEEEWPNFEVRLGGLYALQRVSLDSRNDHIMVMETLCAYMRMNSRRRSIADSDIALLEQDIDIQAALKIIGERSYDQCAFEMNKFKAIEIVNATLVKSNLNRLKLPFVNLDGSDLRFSTLRRADLRQASLSFVNLQYAVFLHCNLRRASLRGADLRNTMNLTQEMLEVAHGVKSGYGRTLLSEGLEAPVDWFIAEEAEEDSEALRQAYFDDLEKFYQKHREHTFLYDKKLVTVKQLESGE